MAAVLETDTTPVPQSVEELGLHLVETRDLMLGVTLGHVSLEALAETDPLPVLGNASERLQKSYSKGVGHLTRRLTELELEGTEEPRTYRTLVDQEHRVRQVLHSVLAEQVEARDIFYRETFLAARDTVSSHWLGLRGMRIADDYSGYAPEKVDYTWQQVHGRLSFGRGINPPMRAGDAPTLMGINADQAESHTLRQVQRETAVVLGHLISHK